MPLTPTLTPSRGVLVLPSVIIPEGMGQFMVEVSMEYISQMVSKNISLHTILHCTLNKQKIEGCFLTFYTKVGLFHVGNKGFFVILPLIIQSRGFGVLTARQLEGNFKT